MEKILEKFYQDLLKSGLSPKDLLAYEQKKQHQLMEKISSKHRVGDFLLKDGSSTSKAPEDVLQIEGIWLAENCVASLHFPEEKLTFDAALNFCMSQKILETPLYLPKKEIYVSRIVRERLKRVCSQKIKSDYYWTALGGVLNEKPCATCFNPIHNETSPFEKTQKAWCLAVLEFSE